MQIETITINGASYPIKFGNGAFKRFCQNHNPPIESLDEFYKQFQAINFESITFKALDKLAQLVLCGVESGCALKGDECNLSFDVVLEAIGDNPEIIREAIHLFTGASPVNKQVEIKKKKSGTKSGS